MLTRGIEDIAFNDEQQPSFNVDALVNENDHEPVRSFRMATPLATPFLEQPRRATPTIPPGFTAPIVHRDLAEVSHSRPGARPMSLATSSNIAPAVPVLPATPKQVTKPEQKSENVEIASPSTPATSKVAPATPSETSSIVKQFKPQTPGDSMKNADVVKETSKHIVEEKRHSPSASVIGASKSNSNSRRSKIAADSSQRKDLPTKTKIVDTSAALIAQVEKRQLPEQLDIAAATKLPEPDLPPASAPFKCDGQGKNVSTQSNSIASVPSSPAIAATGSPTKRSIAPRTLRVIPAPKAEVSQQSSPATTGSSLPHILSVDKLRSRQASIASINPPGTPSSELISDTASVTSTSISRANSPPPVGGKIGTAPVRKKTKSQAKKDRQERKRQIEEEQANAEENKSDIEIVQAPIIGRKKKEKKPSNPPKSIAAVSKSHPGSPKPATVEEEQSDVPATAAKQAISAKVSAQATPEPDSEQNLEHSKDRREYTAQSILTELQQTGELLASKLEFFKPLSSSLTHASRSIQIAQAATPLDMKIHFSGADLEALSKKKPVRLNGRDGKPDTRTLITPNGKFFWGLSEELEAKALELEKHIEELKGHYRFHPRKQMVYGDDHRLVSSNQGKDVLPAIATALKEAGKKLNTDGIQQMPKLDQASGLISSPTRASEVSPPQAPPLAQQQQTPADAGQYLNQFVLPNTDNPPLNQPRPEMAAVGGPPGAGTANISVHVNRFARAAKAVVEGGAVGSTEIEGMGMMATDLIGGVFVQGLDALVGAGLGLQSSQEIGLDSDGNMTLGPDHSGDIDVQGLMQAIESTAGLGGHGGAERRGQGSVLSMEEAEQAMHAARKEHDVLEKKLAVLMKKNRRTALGNSKS